MRKSLAALMLAMLAGSTSISTIGCAKATTESASQPVVGGVSYCGDGWLLTAADRDVLNILDEPNRQAAFDARAAHLQHVFLVPASTFEWLFKQAARSRRAADDAASAGGG